MLLEQLDAKRPDYDAKTWRQYDALYRAGKTFRAMIAEFLPQNELEPDGSYAKRKKAAHFRSYVGPVVNFFAAGMFTSAPVIRAKDGDENLKVEDYYDDFAKNCDCNQKNFLDFMRARFTGSLVKGEAWWLVCLPQNKGTDPGSRAEWLEQGLDQPFLCELDPEQVYDLERDEKGRPRWVLTHSIETPRVSVAASRSKVVETWRLYDDQAVTTYRLEYEADKRPPPNTEVAEVSQVPHGFTRIPIVELRPPAGMWLLDLVADPQIEHFQLSAGLGWAIRRTCYAMMVIARDKNGQDPIVGAGYWLDIGKDESVSYAAPDGGTFATIAAEIAVQKDEIYRITNQMALGVENNAAAVGRSAQSKEADASSSETSLHAYASPVRESIEATYRLLAEGRGEDLTWAVEGLDKFKLSDAASVLDTSAAAKLLAIPSQTFKVEMYCRAADAMLPNLDTATRDKIHEEIEEGVEEELEASELLKSMGMAPQPGAPGQPPGAPPQPGQRPPPQGMKPQPKPGGPPPV